jgi:hypothetical protein
MKLFQILIRHCAPKDCKESTAKWIVAPDDETVMHYIDKELTYGAWGDRDKEDSPFTIYDEDYNHIGTETYFERMLRLRGEFNDPDASYDDAYYGVTHYGWEEGIDITEEEKATLLKLGIIEQESV